MLGNILHLHRDSKKTVNSIPVMSNAKKTARDTDAKSVATEGPKKLERRCSSMDSKTLTKQEQVDL
jgi:hypothetical protein